ncbi:hypothetical protein [Methyloceanibacter caenitepidi]|uniref:hypothetical protein n=1 Tax=Methyloceanibacter caenitepidi TaxID=1384459 RepID=UPI0005F03CF9|nr:hypothetical protein [Methyloceanibacter caenitepidi]
MARTKPKLPISFVSVEETLTIPALDWHQLQDAIDGSIPPRVRDAVFSATNRFLDLERLERAAEPISNAVEHLELWKEGADAFLDLLPTRRNTSTAYVYAKSAVGQYWSHRFPSDPFEETAELIASFRSACEAAQMDLNSECGDGEVDDHFKDGEAWRFWIRTLKDVFKEAGLSTTARRDMPEDDRQSPFVEFVWQLQICLPAGKRHTHSKSALALAISRVR